MSARQRFPALTTKLEHGYSLEVTVHPGPQHVRVSPPQALAPGHVWPNSCFQVLLVASEYCAAVQELITWAFPTDWEDYTLLVAEFAAAFISTSKPVPPPGRAAPGQPGNNVVRRALCHSIWVNFTFLYFNGTRDLNLKVHDGETKLAVAWLTRLVGTHGWAQAGPEQAFVAARAWVESMRARLEPMFSDGVFGPEPPVAVEAGSGGGGTDELTAAAVAAHVLASQRQVRPERELLKRSERGGNSSPYSPTYPYRITSGFSGNRIKCTYHNQERPRGLKVACGVPEAFGQTRNHTLGFLVLADVMQAFSQASSAWPANDLHTKTVVEAFFENVLNSDTKALEGTPGIEMYADCLVGCTLGWNVAVKQVRCWVAAAVPAVVDRAHPPQLVLPRTVTPEVMDHFAGLVQQGMQQLAAAAAEAQAAELQAVAAVQTAGTAQSEAAAQALLVSEAPAALHPPFFQRTAPAPQQQALGPLSGLQPAQMPASFLKPPPQHAHPRPHQQRLPAPAEGVAGGVSNVLVDRAPSPQPQHLPLHTAAAAALAYPRQHQQQQPTAVSTMVELLSAATWIFRHPAAHGRLEALEAPLAAALRAFCEGHLAAAAAKASGMAGATGGMANSIGAGGQGTGDGAASSGASRCLSGAAAPIYSSGSASRGKAEQQVEEDGATGRVGAAGSANGSQPQKRRRFG